MVRPEPRREVGDDPAISRGNEVRWPLLQGTKNGKARTIALPGPLGAILEEHRKRQQQERKALGTGYNDGDLMFARPDGSFVQPWNYASAVRDLAQRVGVKPITLHDLRDTHASLLSSERRPVGSGEQAARPFEYRGEAGLASLYCAIPCAFIVNGGFAAPPHNR